MQTNQYFGLVTKATKRYVSHQTVKAREWMAHSHIRQTVYRDSIWLAHTAYFGAVFFEGHGAYAAMGGVLLVCMIAKPIFGEAE